MAFSRDRKKNPSSRYSRMEEPWLDDRGKRDEWDNSADPRDEGFGVRDSYSRQASYGRPDGYYDSYRPAGGMGDTRVYSSEVTNAARQSASAQGRGTSADRRGASGGAGAHLKSAGAHPQTAGGRHTAPGGPERKHGSPTTTIGTILNMTTAMTIDMMTAKRRTMTGEDVRPGTAGGAPRGAVSARALRRPGLSSSWSCF